MPVMMDHRLRPITSWLSRDRWRRGDIRRRLRVSGVRGRVASHEAEHAGAREGGG
jgi:hypothetical protein